MIRIARLPCPAELTVAEAQRLTAEFVADKKKRVWDKDYIKRTLLAMSSKKCCYCEVDISEESKYMEVEHYECKDAHPQKVVEWRNLLPSCKRCNGEKGAYDVILSGHLVDPTRIDPKSHLYLKSNYRIGWKDKVGKDTVQEIYLNDSDRLVLTRFRVGEKVNEAIDRIKQDMNLLLLSPSSRAANRKVVRAVRALLREADPETELSATAATVITQDEDYQSIRNGLISLGFWDNDLESAHVIASNAALLR